MAKGSPDVSRVIRALGSGTKTPAAQLLSEIGVNNAVVVSKLRNSPVQSAPAKDDRETANVVNYAELRQLADFIVKKKKDSENITKLFPDIELAKQIYVSSTIAPKDMTSTELLYNAEDAIFPPEVVTKLNEVIKRNVEGHHKLEQELQDILRESLFETGSYIIATLPESSIDEVINRDRTLSMESASTLFDTDKKIKSLGYLSDSTSSDGFALESYLAGKMDITKLTTNKISVESVDIGIEVYDNFEMLKMPMLASSMTTAISEGIIRPKYRRPTTVATEDATGKKFTDGEIRSTVFKAQTSGHAPVVSVPTMANAARKSIGRAMRMKLPSESVIPVYAPGQPDKHVGYFILLDHNGAPLTYKSMEGYHNGITSMMNNNVSQNQSTGLSTFLLQKAKDTIVGTGYEPVLGDMARIYSSIVERELVGKLKNGLYKKDLAIAETEDIFRMMMYRSLQGMQTRMLYIPGEMVTYYAYRYHDNGIGKSLLDDLTMLISTRAVVQTARVLQQIRSSINVTNVGVTLDPKDQDPEKTIEMTVANVVKYMQFQMPIGLITQADLSEWVARAGVRFTFEGHPGLPELKYDFNNDTIGNTLPDTDLEEDLARRTYMAFGLSPEQVDNSLSPDFATSVLSSNALLSKRVMNTQDVYVQLLTEDARRIMRYDMVAYKELRAAVKETIGVIKARVEKNDNMKTSELDEEDFITEITERYIDSFTISLPRPDMTSIDNQLEAIGKAEEIIDKLLESHVSSEAFPQMVSGDASNSIDELKGILKAAMMRDWLASNPSFKDLNDIVDRSMDKDGKSTIFDVTKMHYRGFVSSMLKFMADAKPFANAASRDTETIQNNEDTEQPEPEATPEPTDAASSVDADAATGGDDSGNDADPDTPVTEGGLGAPESPAVPE